MEFCPNCKNCYTPWWQQVYDSLHSVRERVRAYMIRGLCTDCTRTAYLRLVTKEVEED